MKVLQQKQEKQGQSSNVLAMERQSPPLLFKKKEAHFRKEPALSVSQISLVLLCLL